MSVVKARTFLILLWFIAISLIIHYGLLTFYSFTPLTHWIEYHSVEPVRDSFGAHERLKFVSHTDLHRNVNLTFSDALFCRDSVGDLEQYSQQQTTNVR